MPVPVDPDLIDQGVAACESGDFDTAEKLFDAAIAINADDADAHNLLGVCALQRGDAAGARRSFETAVGLDPAAAEFHFHLGRAQQAMDQLPEARAEYLEALGLDDTLEGAWRGLGETSQMLRCFEDARSAWRRVLDTSVQDAKLWNNFGLALLHLNQSLEAQEALRQALRLDPLFVLAWSNLLRAQEQAGEFDAMSDTADRLIEADPGRATSYLQKAAVLQRLGRTDDAIEAVTAAIRLDSEMADAHYAMGILLAEIGEHNVAAVAYKRASELSPGNLVPEMNRTYSLLAGGDPLSAIRELQLLDQKFSGRFEIKLQLAESYCRARMYHEAVVPAREAVNLKPEDSDALSTLGRVLSHVGDQGEAEKSYRKALTSMPWPPVAAGNLAAMLAQRGQLADALVLHHELLSRFPNAVHARSNYLLQVNGDPDTVVDDIFSAHREWGRLHTPVGSVSHDNVLEPDRPLRVGYLSPDFREHAVAFFIEPILAAHDRTKITVICYDNATLPDQMTRYLTRFADVWRRIVGMTDSAVDELIRRDRIDVLVDLAGHTAENRLLLFARKPAPVQVTYLGYPNTTGVPQIDYRLTDATADPPGLADTRHTEKLVRLKRTFLAYHPPDFVPEVAAMPALSGGPFTFGSFNALSKLNRLVFDTWAAILLRVPGSTLLMKANGLGDEETKARIAEEFARRGVPRERLQFAKRTRTFVEHLEAYARVDLALDTFPYNGTTTTCESLYMGVPVITLAGEAHVGRVGVSLLSTVGVPELIAGNMERYVELAAELAADVPRVARLRTNLRQTMAASPLMDGASLTRDIEAAFRSMWQDYCRTRSADDLTLGAMPMVPAARPGTRSLLVDGWRFIPHSYALVNQMQCIELAKRPQLTILYHDGPLLRPWERTRGILPPADEQTLADLTDLPRGQSVEVAYRIRYPLDVRAHPAADRTFAFTTVEFPGYGPPVPAGAAADLVTPSEWSKRGLILAGAEPDRVHVVPHGVDTAVFCPLPPEVRNAARSRHRLSGFVYLSVGAMTRNKGVIALLRAFARVSETDPSAMLLLKGSDALYTSRQMLGSALSEIDAADVDRVESRTRYIGGTLRSDEMSALYAAADCYVTPYRAEGFNIPALEAVACGLPVIATGGGPTDAFGDDRSLRRIRSILSEQIIDGRTCEALEPDQSHLLELMQAARTDAAWAASALEAGPAFVRERFTWPIVVNRLLAVLGLHP